MITQRPRDVLHPSGDRPYCIIAARGTYSSRREPCGSTSLIYWSLKSMRKIIDWEFVQMNPSNGYLVQSFSQRNSASTHKRTSWKEWKRCSPPTTSSWKTNCYTTATHIRFRKQSRTSVTTKITPNGCTTFSKVLSSLWGTYMRDSRATSYFYMGKCCTPRSSFQILLVGTNGRNGCVIDTRPL